MRESSNAFFASNHRLGATAIVGNLAKAMISTGKIDEALETLEDALALAEQTGERFYVPELHRLKGEAVLARDPEKINRASDCFNTGCAIAQSQRSLSLELRLRVSLAELRSTRADRAEARETLLNTLSSFSEGKETGDLKLARQVAESGV